MRSSRFRRLASIAFAFATLSFASCREGWEPLAWIAHPSVDARVGESLASPLVSRRIDATPPFGVAVISDLHALESGWPAGDSFLDAMAALDPSERPVLLVATGDLTDGGLAGQFDRVAAFVAECESLGIAFAAVPGNHEFYSLDGWKNWKAAMRVGGDFLPAFSAIDIGPPGSPASLSLVLADSADGTFGATQWPLLERAIAARAGTPLVLCTHMMAYLPDSRESIYRLESADERRRLLAVLSRVGAPTVQVGGHAHVSGSVRAGSTEFVTCGMAWSGVPGERLMTLLEFDAGLSWRFLSW